MTRRARIARLPILAGTLLLTVACAQDAKPPEPQASAPAAPVAAVEAPAAPSVPAVPVPSADPLTDFMAVNKVDRVLDAWLVEMRRQWDEQVAHMKVKPTPGFWEESLKEYDLEAERRTLRESIAAAFTPEELRQDADWMRSSGMISLDARLDALNARVQPLHSRLGAEAVAAAERAGGGVPAPLPLLEPAAAAREMSSADRADIHALMGQLGWGAPGELRQRLIDALKQSMKEAPAGTWSDAQLLAAVQEAETRIERAFAAEFTAADARTIVAALQSPEGRRHDAMIERLTPIVMSRSEPFTKSVQMHVLKRYSKIFNAAWEERQRARGLDPNGAPLGEGR